MGAAYTQGAWWAGLETSGRSLSSWLRLFAWFVWPTGLMALLALWFWRAWWRSPHILWPSSVLLATLVLVFWKTPADRQLLLATPALAVLAAMFLPTMRRTVSAWIDWFTLMFFSACALTIWVVWLSLETGWPAQPARNVARLLPGLQYAGNAWASAAALAVTLLWLRSIVWRVGRDRSALWKSLAIPAGGAAVCWVLLMSLWFPLLNYARSYSNMMDGIAQASGQVLTDRAQAAADTTKPKPCIYVQRLSPEHAAALYFYQPLQPVRYGVQTKGQRCVWLLRESTDSSPLPSAAGQGAWLLHKRVQRAAADDETLALYHLQKPEKAY